jgi:hypothetical protein
MMRRSPPKPTHVSGTNKGEEAAMRLGREPGRGDRKKNGYRSARDATSIDPEGREPIDPRMPEMPPA